MKTCTALIKGRPLKYRVRRNPQARRLRVWVSRENGVVVTLPSRAPARDIEHTFAEWEDWLEEKVTIEGVWDGPIIREYASGSTILFMGSEYVLEITGLPEGRKRRRISAEDGILKMELPPLEVLNSRPALEKFLRKQAREKLQSRVEFWSERTQLFPSKVIVGERTSRWGSCTTGGTLSFCYRLILAPPEVMDAIIVHELCHLKHMNHGKKFWALVEQFNPDYAKHRKWLADHADQLQV